MSVQNVNNNAKAEVTTLKKEIDELNKKVEVISKDKNAQAPSIFIDPEKRAGETKDKEALAREESWINYIISMLERLAASHERVSNNIDGVETPKYNFYNPVEPTADEVKDKEAKDAKDKEDKKVKDKEDKEVKAKDKDDKEVKVKDDKEVKTKDDKEVKAKDKDDKEVKVKDDKEVKKQDKPLVA